jgi:L-arabinose transport system permease protein
MLDNLGMLGIFIVLFVALSATVPNFLSRVNLIGLALSVSLVGMVACTMLFCMASGDFDLSVEAIVAAAGVLAAVVINATGSVWLGVLAGVAGGWVVGWVNGVVIARIGINALITTLATLQIVRGIGLIISRGSAVGVTQPAFFTLGNSRFAGVPTPVWITIACFVVFGIIFHRTRFGRYTLAIGGNREAARLSGVPVQRVQVVIFAVQGAVSGLAGVVLASRMTSGQPNTSQGFALDVIAACVLGGVSLTGGVGTMLGVIVGVLIMGTVQNAMNLSNVPAFYQYVVRGAILLAAVIFDRWRRARALSNTTA